MSNSIIGGPLLFSEPDCPTREGEVVNTLEDIYNIPSPRVGMRVFVKDTKKSYIVTKLKEEEINGVLVPNAKVDEFEDIQPDVAGMNDAIQNSISTLNRTIINYNTRYDIAGAVTKQQVIEDLLNRGTADRGCIVTYYAEDGWHTIQYKLNYYNPTQGVKESNWVEIVNEDTIKSIKDSIDNAYVKPESGIPKNDLSAEVQEVINNVGKVADGSVTEQKLSFDVKDKLNTAYDKANLADGLFLNNGIVFKKGVLTEEGVRESVTDYAYSNKILGNGETITVGNGYKIINYKVYDGEEEPWFDNNYNDTTLFLDKGYVFQFSVRGGIITNYNNIVKSFIRNPYDWDSNSNLNNFICAGRYTISGSREANANDNMPIYNGGNIEAKLEVIENENTLVQILTLLNVGGGDGNIYTRTWQNGSWDAWGKLQTNIEVGLIGVGQSKTFDDFIDNGMYSGVNAYWTDAVNYITSVETFVLVVINAYLYDGGIAQLKYSTLLDGTTTVKIRTRVNDSWGEWQSIGGDESSYTLPVATADALGGIKSATSRPVGSDVSEGRKCDVYVDGNSGLAHVVVAPASYSSYGVVKVDNSVNSESNNPVSGKAVAEAIDTPVVNQTANTATIAPNVLNIWGEVAELDITLGEPKVGVINEYMFQFTSGATATTLVLPADIKWVAAPNIQANKTYQVSIINNLGVIGEFSHE